MTICMATNVVDDLKGRLVVRVLMNVQERRQRSVEMVSIALYVEQSVEGKRVICCVVF